MIARRAVPRMAMFQLFPRFGVLRSEMLVLLTVQFMSANGLRRLCSSMTFRDFGTITAVLGFLMFAPSGFAQSDIDQMSSTADAAPDWRESRVSDSASFLRQAILCERDSTRRAILVNTYRTIFNESLVSLPVLHDLCRGLPMWEVPDKVLGLLQSSIDAETDSDRKQKLIDLRATYASQSEIDRQGAQSRGVSQNSNVESPDEQGTRGSGTQPANGSGGTVSSTERNTLGSTLDPSKLEKGVTDEASVGDSQLQVMSESTYQKTEITNSATHDVLEQQLNQFDEFLSNAAKTDTGSANDASSQHGGSSSQEHSESGIATNTTDSKATPESNQLEGESSEGKPTVPWSGILEENNDKPKGADLLTTLKNSLTPPVNANSTTEGTEGLVEDDVARFLREAIEEETDPVKKAELQAQYDAYMKK